MLNLLLEIPYNDYFEYYAPDYRLHVPSTNMDNMNPREYLEKFKCVPPALHTKHFHTKLNKNNQTRARILDSLRDLPHAPSVNNQDVPPDLLDSDEDDDEDDPDSRFGSSAPRHGLISATHQSCFRSSAQPSLG